MNNLCDVHSHVYYSSSVSTLCCATSFESWTGILSLPSGVKGALGIHPWFLSSRPDDWACQLETHLQDNSDLLIGECGLDFYKRENRHDQIEVFNMHLQLAQKYGRPLSIHCVHSWDEMFLQLKQIEIPSGSVMHRFGGSIELAKRCISLGLLISLGPEILQRKSNKTQRLITEIPLEYLVTESDAEATTEKSTSYIEAVIVEIATLKKMDVTAVRSQIRENCKILFG